VPNILATEISKQFNITEKIALQNIEEVVKKHPLLKKSRKILKKLDNIPKFTKKGQLIYLQKYEKDELKRYNDYKKLLEKNEMHEFTPKFNDIDENAGTNFIICLLNKISKLPDYAALRSMKTSIFMDRIRKQVDEDNVVKAKIYNAVNNISGEIDFIDIVKAPFELQE
jgi:hypothetical protein